MEQVKKNRNGNDKEKVEINIPVHSQRELVTRSTGGEAGLIHHSEQA